MKTVGFDLILKALDVALDRRKIVFAVAGLFAAFLASALFLWLASKTRDDGLSTILNLLGLLISWVISTLVTGAVAKMSYDELSDRPAQGWSAALNYSLSHWTSLILSPLALLIGIILIAVGELAILFLGRIPYLGELWASLLFPLLIVLNIFLILLGFLSSWLIRAATRSTRCSMPWGPCGVLRAGSWPTWASP